MSQAKPGGSGQPGAEPSTDEHARRVRRVREAEQERGRLRQLVDRSHDSLVLHDLDGRVLEANRFAHACLGYSREEFLALRVSDYDPQAGVEERWSQLRLDSSVVFERRFRHKLGHEIPFEVVIVPFEEQGQRLFVAVGRDISERKAAQAARERNELRFQAVFEGAPTGLLLIDEGGRIVAANPALEAMLEAPSGAMVGKTIAALTHEADAEQGLEQLEQLRRGEREHVRFETRCHGPGGKLLWAELSAFRYSDPETSELRSVAFIEDISERRRIEEQRREMFERLDELVATRTAALEQEINERKRTERELHEAMRAAEGANLAKSQFLASMSHELRTPLNAVIGYSEMLIEDAEDSGDTEFVPDLERIRNAGKHLLGIINDILDLSKVEAGKIELHVEPVAVRGVLDEVVATVGPLAQKNNNQLELDVQLRGELIETDATRLRQVLFNLLSNACKFTEAGRVELRVREVEREGEPWVRFDIRDTGLGIKSDQLDRLFRPFTQADASTSRRFGGTGLGLSISDQFARMLGGRIDVDSEYGVGSTFTLWLPRAAPEAAAAISSPRRRIRSAIDPVGTVLVVDDEAEPRELLATLLESEGYEVVCAPTGPAALELAEAHKPDLITLDVLMPGMDGWAVLSRLRQHPELADIPVVIVSLIPDTDLGYALGATDVLGKPVRRERLLNLLSQYRPGDGPSHILVVDDDEHARDLLCRAVLKEGWHVEEAENGLLALEAARRRRPRLMILDLMMPKMDGFEVLEHLRADAELRSLPVIVVTAKQLSASERAFLSARVQSIMQKGGYSRTDLVGHVRSLVGRSLGGLR